METEIKQRWAELIEKTGKTKTEIANLAKVNKSNITNYCTDKYQAKQETIFNVCRPLGINPSWLMGYDVPMYLSSKNEPCTDYEVELLNLFRLISVEDRRMILAMLEGVLKSKGLT